MGNMTMRTRVRSLPVGRPLTGKEAPGKSTALPEDPFKSMYGTGAVLQPTLDPGYLTGLPHYSETLGPAIAAMSQNVDGFGHQYVARMKPANEAERVEAEAERAMLESFFNYAVPDMSFVRLRKNRRTDMETTGRGYVEFIRSTPTDEHPNGRISGFNHVRSKNVRFCVEDKDPQLAKAWRFNDETKTWEEYEYYQRFRKFVHQVGGINRYFRQFGDPRQMDMATGRYFTHDNAYVLTRLELTEEERKVAANELWCETIYDPDDVQGNPRWLGAELDVQNNRLAAESANDYLAQGGVPLCFMAVQGGALDPETFDRVNHALQDAQGNHPENRMIIVEVVAQKTEAGPLEGGQTIQPKIEVTKLNDLQRSDDSMFLSLRERGSANVLLPFRINSLFMGKNNDQTFATANVSMQLNESQVFAPERDDFDWFMNNRVLPELRVRWWLFKSNGPKLEDNESWVEATRMAIEFGAVPDYQTLRAILSEVLDYELPTGDEAGNVAEWEKMPPGFVKQLMSVVQGFPTFSDLEDTLVNVGIGGPADDDDSEGHPDVAMPATTERGLQAMSSRHRSRPSLADRVATQIVQIMVRARAKLAAREADRDVAA